MHPHVPQNEHAARRNRRGQPRHRRSARTDAFNEKLAPPVESIRDVTKPPPNERDTGEPALRKKRALSRVANFLDPGTKALGNLAHANTKLCILCTSNRRTCTSIVIRSMPIRPRRSDRSAKASDIQRDDGRRPPRRRVLGKPASGGIPRGYQAKLARSGVRCISDRM